LPQQWKESVIEPIYKEGEKTDSNYRGISLLPTTQNFIVQYSLKVNSIHRITGIFSGDFDIITTDEVFLSLHR